MLRTTQARRVKKIFERELRTAQGIPITIRYQIATGGARVGSQPNVRIGATIETGEINARAFKTTINDVDGRRLAFAGINAGDVVFEISPDVELGGKDLVEIEEDGGGKYQPRQIRQEYASNLSSLRLGTGDAKSRNVSQVIVCQTKIGG